MTSHNAVDVTATFERVVMLSQGRVVFDGPVVEFLAGGQDDPQVAAFVAALRAAP
jgi:ABC-type uncharacterized transport system ATPase subunit